MENIVKLALNKGERFELNNSRKVLVVTNCGYTIIHNTPINMKVKWNNLDYCLIYLHKGSMTIKIGEKDETVQAGSIVILSPLFFNESIVRYTFTPCETNEHYFVYFKGTMTSGILENLGLHSYPVMHTGDLSAQIKNFTDIIEDFKIHDFNHDVIRTTKLLNILTGASEKIMPDSRLKNSLLQPAVSLMENGYNTKITLSKCAELCSLSVSSFIRIFKKQYNMSPIKYLENIRLEKACYFLSYTDMTISEISLNLGFGDSLYFSKFFRIKTGLSPKVFREKNSAK